MVKGGVRDYAKLSPGFYQLFYQTKLQNKTIQSNFVKAFYHILRPIRSFNLILIIDFSFDIVKCDMKMIVKG